MYSRNPGENAANQIQVQGGGRQEARETAAEGEADLFRLNDQNAALAKMPDLNEQLFVLLSQSVSIKNPRVSRTALNSAFSFFFLHYSVKKPAAAKEVKHEPFSFPDGML